MDSHEITKPSVPTKLWHDACLSSRHTLRSHENLAMIELSSLFARRISGPALILSLALAPAVVHAGPHRARLSKDLEARLATGSTGATSVIISGTETTIQSLAQRYGATIKKLLRGGAVFEVTGDQLDALSSDPSVAHLSGDVRVQRMIATATEATGAPQVWQGIAGLRGFTGQGVGVAVIDSGVAGEHVAIRRHLVEALDLTAKKGTAADRFGHGTHVAGIIAGTDETGDYSGVAPGAHIVSLKVLGPEGSGDTSDVINAIDWAIEHKASHALRIINLSLGRPVFESYRDDPLCHAVQRAVDAGLVVVAAAGNLGKTEDGRPIAGAVMAPGSCPSSLTVGALNTGTTVQRSDDVVATYSSRGPTAIDGLMKPDLVAPGNKIVAAAAPGSYLVQTYPERIVAGRGANAYIQFSGTSMAAAEVSGVTALLLEANPSLTPADVKLLLQVTSSPVSGAGLIEAGAGSVNAAAAVALSLAPSASPVETTIGGETAVYSGIAFGSALDGQLRQSIINSILVWGSSLFLGGTSAARVEFDILVWGSGLVWGNTDVSGNILVWGSQSVSSDILVWGSQISADILVWGNILVWGSADVNADILVWGSTAVSD